MRSSKPYTFVAHHKLALSLVFVIVSVLVVAGIVKFDANRNMSPILTEYAVDTQPSLGSSQPANSTSPASQSEASLESHASTQSNLLLYLIEEEKLAHDVYTVMFQIYGSRVFENILSSEQTHQSKVLALLQARGIDDPRSSELGKFTNSELQNLYNDLIAQGKQNLTEAFKVGVAIEEKDIADLTNQLATATDPDIISTLELLKKGSENHLQAFNRQLSKN